MRHLRILAALLAAACSCSAAPRAVLDTTKIPAPGEALVWSPLFQAAWDKLGEIPKGKMEKVVPPNALITKLDKFRWNKGIVMPPGGWGVYAGSATPEFAKEVARDVKSRLRMAMPADPLTNDPQHYAIYAVMARDLTFEKQFFRSRRRPLVFKDGTGKLHNVAFFGTAGELSDNYGASVKVLAYDRRRITFTLSIATDKPGERIIIHRPDHLLSFQTAIEHVASAIKTPLAGPYGSPTDDTLHKKDTVKIPYLRIDSRTDLTDLLKGKIHYAGEPLPWTIVKARQFTEFDLFEKGARIRVVADIEIEPFGPAPRRRKIIYVPRNFICDVPFFVAAWRDGAPMPYFAAWIDGPDALVPFGKQ